MTDTESNYIDPVTIIKCANFIIHESNLFKEMYIKKFKF